MIYKVSDIRANNIDYICRSYIRGMHIEDIAEATGYTTTHVRNVLLMRRTINLGDPELRIEARNYYEKFCSNKTIGRLCLERDIRKTRSEIIESELKYHVKADRLEEKLERLIDERRRFLRK